MLEIRFARPEPTDIEIIFHFITQLAAYEKLSDQVVATPEKLYHSLFHEKSAEVLLAFVDGEAAGFALFFHNYSTFLAQKGIYLEDLYVDEKKRGHGIGKALLKQLAVIATQRNCGRLEWSVLDWNKPAIDFYLSLGAKPNEEWTVYRMSKAEIESFAGSP